MKINYYTDVSLIEENATEALSIFENAEGVEKIAVFPDIHYCSEKSLPVGVAFRTQDYFYPLITGKDMGCGVAFLRIEKSKVRNFDKYKHYRAFEKESYRMTDEGLGGGNHFLSFEESEKFFYVVVHTGSRNLGIYMFQKNYQLSNGTGKLHISVADQEYVKDYEKIIEYARKRREEFLVKTFDFLVKNSYVSRDTSYTIVDSVHNHLEFADGTVIHRKGSTALKRHDEVIIPLSMSRGSIIVKANEWNPEIENALWSCSHGAGRKLSRTDTLKFWYSLKKAEKEDYKAKFPELLNRSGEFESSILQEFDFAYKDTNSILESQPYLLSIDKTTPIATVKFTGI